MFADTATKVDLYGKRKPKGLWAMFPYIRSHTLMSKGKDQWGTPIPSVHFRHKGTANVSWGDGHITQEPLETSKGEWGKYGIGCLGTDNDHELIP
jgi:prepilin-type processing-associated H-X9-DG protein